MLRVGSLLRAVLSVAFTAALTGAAAADPVPVFVYKGSTSGSATALAVDGRGASYVVGRYASFTVPASAAQASETDGWVAKVKPGGEGLEWATWLGGLTRKGDCYKCWVDVPRNLPTHIAVDPAGSVVVAGITYTTDFPLVQPVVSGLGSADAGAFLTKINADGTRFTYSTYLGAASVAGLAVDATGNAYVALVGNAALSYETQNLSRAGVVGHSTLVKVNPAGGVVFATRFGGPSTTVERIIADGSGSIVVSGTTERSDLDLVRPATSACASFGALACGNPFLLRVDPSGRQLVYATMLGGSDGGSGLTSLILSPSGSVVVAGWTRATDFPLRNAGQTVNAGGTDGVALSVTPDGVVSASTYVGSLASDSLTAIGFDGSSAPLMLATTNGSGGAFGDLARADWPLWVSHDNGSSWSSSSTGLPGVVTALAESPRGRVWYAGTDEAGVFRSLDGGQTWQRAGTAGLVRGRADKIAVTAVVADPAHDGVVYVATGTGLYRSDDRGERWQPIGPTGVTLAQGRFLVDGNGWILLPDQGRILRSQDAGATWAALGPVGDSMIWRLAFDPNTPGFVAAIQTDGSVFRSADGGITWHAWYLDGPDARFSNLVFSAGRPGRIVAGRTCCTIVVSNDGANSWQAPWAGSMTPLFAVAPQPDTMLAFDDGPFIRTVLRTVDGGSHWTPISIPGASLNTLIFDSLQPSTLFAAGSVAATNLLLRLSPGLNQSTYRAVVNAAPTATVTDATGAIYLLETPFRLTKLPAIPLVSTTASAAASAR